MGRHTIRSIDAAGTATSRRRAGSSGPELSTAGWSGTARDADQPATRDFVAWSWVHDRREELNLSPTQVKQVVASRNRADDVVIARSGLLAGQVAPRTPRLDLDLDQKLDSVWGRGHVWVDGVELDVTVEVHATRPEGFGEDNVRVLLENARTLKFTTYGFED